VTSERLFEIRALAEAATSGSWAYDMPDEDGYGYMDGPGHEYEKIKREDGLFIAAARTAIPELLDALERVKAVTRISIGWSDQSYDASVNGDWVMWSDILSAIEGKEKEQ
jgi:hypothetical protein